MKNLKLIIIFVFLCFTTCKKADRNENLCYSSTLIIQVNSGNLAVHGLTYNSDCLIYESTEPFTYKRFTYDNQGTLKKVEVAYSFNAFSCSMVPGQSLESDPRKAAVSQYSEFEYDDAFKLKLKSFYVINNGKAVLSTYQEYEYTDDRVTKISTFNPSGLLLGYHDYSYDSRGNLTKDDQYTSPSRLYNSVFYEFDDKNNPYQVFAAEGIPGKYSNKNNIVTETQVSYYGTAESRTLNSNVYEYNSLNYPVRINTLDCIYGK